MLKPLVITSIVLGASPFLFSNEIEPSVRRSKAEALRVLIQKAAKHDGKVGLTVAELEHAIGPVDRIESSEVLSQFDKRVYLLSGGRELHVHHLNGDVHWAIITGERKQGAVLLFK